jgi:hypothetical protein
MKDHDGSFVLSESLQLHEEPPTFSQSSAYSGTGSNSITNRIYFLKPVDDVHEMAREIRDIITGGSVPS